MCQIWQLFVHSKCVKSRYIWEDCIENSAVFSGKFETRVDRSPDCALPMWRQFFADRRDSNSIADRDDSRLPVCPSLNRFFQLTNNNQGFHTHRKEVSLRFRSDNCQQWYGLSSETFYASLSDLSAQILTIRNIETISSTTSKSQLGRKFSERNIQNFTNILTQENWSSVYNTQNVCLVISPKTSWDPPLLSR